MTPALVDRLPRRLSVSGRQVDVRVRESSVARTTRILLGAERPLEIIVPAGTSDLEVDRALAERRTWIADKLELVEAEQRLPHSLGLQRAATVWRAGKPMPAREEPAARAAVLERDGGVVVRGPNGDARRDALMRWYRRTARAAIGLAVKEEVARLDLRPASVAVRDQRTRWGSCSKDGNLSFNWRLVIAPVDVLRYVVDHELCHLKVANHSKAFWRQLEAASPGWQTHAAWLAEHGAELRAYKPRL